jgi:hypothetical protein
MMHAISKPYEQDRQQVHYCFPSQVDLNNNHQLDQGHQEFSLGTKEQS